MKINNLKISDNDISNIAIPNFLLEDAIDSKMNKIDDININFNNLDKDIEDYNKF